MKKKLLIIVLLIFQYSEILSQIITIDTAKFFIEYDYSYRINKGFDQYVNELISLYIGNNSSISQTSNAFKSNKILREASKNGLNLFNTKGRTMSKVHVYTVHKIHDSLFVDHTLPKIKFKTPSYNFEWEIKKDKKIILGYECVKAEGQYGNRKFIAWFSIEIPISDGPYVFNGLPGLILEIYDENNDHIFTAKRKEISNEEIVQSFGYFKYKKPGKWIQKEKEKYKNLINTGRISYFGHIQNIDNDSPERREELLIRASLTNSIEL
ncbi:GLPGLI family protein [Flammeovirga pectinis]|uniref:GLPGLI family protein n=1 Tax=Flammeovirga pectinis TaxID=2494373 RepID=A0A3Q9FSZ6_9BACT|nr:GLPGLI family protein [Flammeovirga pectinis]AZQ63946.1 GLPGLI family protein [Flammeovirga pectinis]